MADDQIALETEQGPTTTFAPVGAIDNQNGAASTVQSDEKDFATEESHLENGSAERADSDEKLGENEVTTKEKGDTKSSPTNQRNRDRTHFRKRHNNNKFDPSVRGISGDATAIRNLVEFYFGDTNLRTDAHLLDLLDGSTNLPVKISHIHTFKRMRVFQPYSAVVAALRDSKFLDVTGPEGLEEIRRKTPYDPKREDRSLPSTVYVKGFGEETATTQFDVEAFFAQYGPTNCVRLRRTDDKTFKGSCFVEFQDEKTAQDFLALDPKPLWQGKQELKIMSRADYLKQKNDMIHDGEMDPNTTREYRGRGRGGMGGNFRGGREKRDRGDRDLDDWKKRREDDQRSGFRDNKRDRDNRSQRGRGRGRGNDRGPRNFDRNQERKERDETSTKVEDGIKTESSAQVADIVPEHSEASKKHGRGDDADIENVPAKRLDIKPEPGNEAV